MRKSLTPALALVILSLTACGKYAPPIPPELLSPRSVESLEATADVEGVMFRWRSPETDLRSEELKTMDGYRIYRKELVKPAAVVDEEIPFDLIGGIPDTHVLIRDNLREEARKTGKPSHRVTVDSSLTKFEFRDTQAQSGATYLYKIVPYNQGDVEGETANLVKVAFRGDASHISLMPYSSLNDETFLAQYE